MLIKMLQRKLFRRNEPHYNYAVLGSMIAHEMARAFIGEGQKLYLDGRKQKWMSATSTKLYEEHKGCLNKVAMVNGEYKSVCSFDFVPCFMFEASTKKFPVFHREFLMPYPMIPWLISWA